MTLRLWRRPGRSVTRCTLSQLHWKLQIQVCTKVASYLEQGQRLENLSWRLWHIQNLMVDTDNARSKREFKKLSKYMSDKLDKEKGRYVVVAITIDVDNIYLNSGALRSSKLLILSTQLLPTSFASGLLKRSAIVNRILTALSNVCNSPSASTNPLPPALIFRSRSPTSSLLLNSLNELELLFVLKRTGLQFIFLLPVVLPIEAMIW